MNEDKERKEFEVMIRKETAWGVRRLVTNELGYHNPYTNAAWVGYQAGRAAASKQEVNGELLAVFDEIESSIAEFDHDPAQCLAIIGEIIGRSRHAGAIAHAEQAQQKEPKNNLG